MPTFDERFVVACAVDGTMGFFFLRLANTSIISFFFCRLHRLFDLIVDSHLAVDFCDFFLRLLLIAIVVASTSTQKLLTRSPRCWTLSWVDEFNVFCLSFEIFCFDLRLPTTENSGPSIKHNVIRVCMRTIKSSGMTVDRFIDEICSFVVLTLKIFQFREQEKSDAKSLKCLFGKE